jgi:hypothetical protein
LIIITNKWFFVPLLSIEDLAKYLMVYIKNDFVFGLNSITLEIKVFNFE